jgi:hypothetical protein
LLWVIDADVVVVGLKRQESRPAYREVEFAARGEDRVAEGLGFEAAAGEMPEEAVVSVDGGGARG